MNKGEDWTIEGCRNWQELGSDPVQRDVSAALAWFLLDAGIGEITVATFSKVMTRIRKIEEATGFKLHRRGPDGSYPLVAMESDDVYRRIGMRARVTPRGEREFNELIKREMAAKKRHEEKYGKADAA